VRLTGWLHFFQQLWLKKVQPTGVSLKKKTYFSLKIFIFVGQRPPQSATFIFKNSATLTAKILKN
jgi:hypothetical protein